MSTLLESQVPQVARQSDVISKNLRDIHTNIKNAINDNQDQISNLSSAATNAETSTARPNHADLKARLDSINLGQYNYMKSGGDVTINAGDSQKVDISAGEANVNGIDCKWSAQTSGTIAYTSSDTRFDVVVINSDNTVSVVTGSESANPELPTVTVTQRPVWVLSIGTASVSLGWDARNQGCIYFYEGRLAYSWYIQDAIDNLTSGGTIEIGDGQYYESLTYDDNQILSFSGNAILKNPTGGATISFEDIDISAKTKTSITYPGMSRALPPIGSIIGISPETNATPDSKYWQLCDGSAYSDNTYFNNSNTPTLNDDRFLMGDNVSSENTGGENTINFEHTHKWMDGVSNRSNSPGTFDSSGDHQAFGYSSSAGPAGPQGLGNGVTGSRAHVDVSFGAGGSFAYYTNNALSSTQTNKPLYFSVKYYIRIK